MCVKRGTIICGLLVFYLASIPIAATEEEPVRRLRKAHTLCAPQFPTSSPSDNNSNEPAPLYGAYIRCMSTKMGLWTDNAGFSAKRVAKFFINHRNYKTEVITVVDYCNTEHQQTNLNQWADEAYRCATEGRMGIWLAEYVLNGKI